MLLGRSNFGRIALQRLRQHHAVGGMSTDVQATHHLILSRTSPVIGISFDAESLNGGRKSALADDGLPGARGSFDNACHEVPSVQCTETVTSGAMVNSARHNSASLSCCFHSNKMVGRDRLELSTKGL